MKLFDIRILVYGLLLLLAAVDAARILAIFPAAARSHFLCYEGLMRSLYEAGHHITFITPFHDDESLKNYTVASSKASDTLVFIGQTPLSFFKNMTTWQLFEFSTEHDESYCHNVLKLKEIQDVLNSNEKKYDILFVEMLYMYECYLPLAEKLDVPVVGLITFRWWKLAHPNIHNGYSPSIGNPYHPVVNRFECSQSTSTLTFWERVRNVLHYAQADLFHYLVIRPKVDRFYKQYYPAHLWHKKKFSLIYYNSHHSVFPLPLVPNAIQIGGIHLKPGKPLPQDIQKFIDDAEHGVILFSLGSVVPTSTLGSEMLAAFRDAFAAIPQRVIWKLDDDIEYLSKNVLTMSWVPQRDILAHKNVKAFISHCGISSIHEAIFEGKPMVLTPLFADQFTNAARLVEIGVGVYVDVDSVKKENVLEAISDVINDTSYWDRMQDLSRRFKDRPMTPQETAVYWTEYVIRHKGALHLRTVAADMPLYQYLLLDVVLFATSVVLAVVYVFYFILRKLFSSSSHKKKYRVNSDKKRS